MSKRNYERLSIEDFGKQLLTSKDLDPIYVSLFNLRHTNTWDDDQIKRWLVAYWCYYHAGVACYLSSFKGLEFWGHMSVAAENITLTPAATDQDLTKVSNRWPRASERRHFRGKQAIAAVNELADKYPHSEDMVDHIILQSDDPQSYAEVAKRAKSHRGFGDWISFKICDMIERVLDVPINFDQAAVFMFKDPVKAAFILWRQKLDLPESATPKDPTKAISEVVSYLTEFFHDYSAPPGHDRLVGLAEVETILCKWKSHLHGHYPLLNDTEEIVDGLAPWAKVNDSAQQFLQVSPGCEKSSE